MGLNPTHYDNEHDSAYVCVKPEGRGRGEHIVRTVEVVPDRVMLDFDADGHLVGIEVLDLSKPFYPATPNGGVRDKMDC